MLEKAQQLMEEFQMFSPGDMVLCAVSGGADSMCLLHLLSQQGGLRVHAAHFNHKLRGPESERDAAFVADWCARNGIPFHLGAGDVASEAARLGQGLEETGRQLRYRFLRETAQAIGASVIATAHNAEDNAETMLLHLLRGTGLQGLTGIAPRRGRLVRPLLTTSRQEIEAYLKQYDLPHVEDSSNADDRFLRNRIRHQLLPTLEEWSPGFVRRLSDTAPRLRADNDYLTALAEQLCAQAQWDGTQLSLPADLLTQAPLPVALRAARLLLSKMASGDSSCSAVHLKGLLNLCHSENPSARLSLPGGLTARRAYGLLILSYENPPPIGRLTPVGEWTPIPGTSWVLHLCGPSWEGLEIRHRQRGDTIALPGRPNKRIKVLLIDEKVPRWKRERIPVAADSDGVLAMAGFGPNTAHPRHRRVQFIKEKEEIGNEPYDA